MLKQHIAQAVRKLVRVSGVLPEFEKLQSLIKTESATVLAQYDADVFLSNRVDKGSQLLLAQSYRGFAAQQQALSLQEVEFRNFSQTGEDGILLYLFSVLGTTNKVAVEMCAGVGYECNSANLIVNHGWHGLLFDGDPDKLAQGRKYFSEHPDTRSLPPSLIQAWITAENVNDLIRNAGVEGEIDLFSLDVDGVDYWIWKALDVISPRVVVVEFQSAWEAHRAVTVPYSPEFVAQWCEVGETGGSLAQYSGASLPAFVALAKQKGYRLVGVNSLEYNAFFVREDICPPILAEVNAADCFKHPVKKWCNSMALKTFKELEWVDV